MARPTKLTAAVAERILSAIRAGNYAQVAAQYAGISTSTFYRWLERGDPASTSKAERPYREFRASVERAQAEAEVRDVTLIGKAASSHWQAAAWRLRHRHRERWGASPTKQSSETAVPPTAPPGERLDLAKLSTTELRELRRLHVRAGFDS